MRLFPGPSENRAAFGSPYRRAGTSALVAAVLTATAASTAMAASARAAIPSSTADTRPTAIVSMGDSYISGEAGRWQANGSPTVVDGDVYGTDRAAYNCTLNYTVCLTDPARVYGASAIDGCNRSDVAEIQSAPIAVDQRVNLACSGAVTTNVLPAADGGTSFKTEPPQADQLVNVAKADSVKMVVLSIGGNDLGFADILTSCVGDYLANSGPCQSSQQPVLDAALKNTEPKIEHTLSAIRATMTAAGYSDTDYRLVLQSYPGPIPRGAENRYPETDTRENPGGCPFYNTDSTWARDTVVPAIATMLKQAATAQHAEFLDLQNAFQGREACAKGVAQATIDDTLANPPSASGSEWVRFLTIDQGELQEVLHPNAFGQQALGACLGLLYSAKAGNYACTNTAGQGPEQMVLTAI